MSDRGSDRRSDLARVRGLGSAKEGVHHWWMQRVTAVALVPLSIWFVARARRSYRRRLRRCARPGSRRR